MIYDAIRSFVDRLIEADKNIVNADKSIAEADEAIMSASRRIYEIDKIIQGLMCVLITCMVIITSTTISKADTNREYSIKQANFDITLKENGDAVVTEIWKLNYSGEFSRFYKTFMSSQINELESFTDITNFKVYINGEE